MPNGRKLEPAAWYRFDSQGQFLSDAASVDDARERFLSAVVKLEPTVLADLKAEAASITEVKFDEIDRFVARWAQRYYLNESWCKDWAITQFDSPTTGRTGSDWSSRRSRLCRSLLYRNP